MIPYKKILIPTDDSEKTSTAIHYGISIAQAMGADVTAMCVIDEGDYIDANVAVPGVESTIYQKSSRAVGSIMDQGRAMGVRVRPLVMSGDPANEIVRASSDNDLIVMGTAGLTGVQHLLLGSVAEKVVRSSRCPVLVVRSGAGVDSGAPTVKRLLIPTDGSENSMPAIAHGLSLAKVLSAEVTAFSVADPGPDSRQKTREVGRISMDACREATGHIVDEGRIFGVTVTPTIVTGAPSEEIVKASAEHDLIVMGTAGRTGLAHVRLGSVAEMTVRQARCPVLVVRARGP
jgi:nucleotide-binding universal stress UspA family protein